MNKPELYQENVKVVNLLDALYYLNHLEAKELGVPELPRGHSGKLPNGMEFIKERLWANWCAAMSEFGNDRYLRFWLPENTPEDTEKYYKEQMARNLIDSKASKFSKDYYTQDKMEEAIQHIKDMCQFFDVFDDQVNENTYGDKSIVAYISW